MKKRQENNNAQTYIAPDMEIVSVRVENGFAASPGDNLPRATDNDLGEY